MSNRRTVKNAKVVDLYCGIGALTHGMVLEGLNVVAGVDSDGSCRFAYEKNNPAKFIHKDISRFSSKELRKLYRGASIRILIGCAPCQPFSSISKKGSAYKTNDVRWGPLRRFIRLIKDVKPHIVSMENVPGSGERKEVHHLWRVHQNAKQSRIQNCVQCGRCLALRRPPKTKKTRASGIPAWRNRMHSRDTLCAERHNGRPGHRWPEASARWRNGSL